MPGQRPTSVREAGFEFWFHRLAGCTASGATTALSFHFFLEEPKNESRDSTSPGQPLAGEQGALFHHMWRGKQNMKSFM